MFILWSKQKFDGKYILFAENILNDLKEKFIEFCEINKDLYEINEELKEEELTNFSLYDKDENFYYCEIEDVNVDDEIYIFIFQEDGEGGDYHNELYFRISNNKEELLEIATEFFESESKNIEIKDITEMLEELNKNEYYEIQYGISYCCTMELFKFVKS
jgi:hypothetical protein